MSSNSQWTDDAWALFRSSYLSKVMSFVTGREPMHVPPLILIHRPADSLQNWQNNSVDINIDKIYLSACHAVANSGLKPVFRPVRQQWLEMIVWPELARWFFDDRGEMTLQ